MAPSPLAPEVLVQHAGFVRRVAYALLRDDADADDAAQEALAAGLRAGPDDPAAARGWLATVVRNAARRLRRTGARADARHARCTRPDVAGSAADAAARAEAVRAVAAAVAALSPPALEVVLLRHHDGLPPRAIAARLGQPVATVKKRLERAHAELRARLDGHRPGGRDRRRALLAAGLRSPTDLGAGGALMALGTTGKVALAGVAVLVAAVAGLGGLGARDEGPAPDPARASRPATATAVPAGLARPAALATARGAAEAPPRSDGGPAADDDGPPTAEALAALVTPVERGVLDVLVLRGRRPVAGARVRLEPVGGAPATATTDEEGCLRRDLGEVKVARVHVEVEGVSPRVVVWRTEPAVVRTRRVVLVGRGRVDGVVRDATGRPSPRCEVGLSMTHGDLPSAGGMLTATCDADGGFSFTGVPGGTWTLFARVEAPGVAQPATLTATVRVPDGGLVVADLGPAADAPRWAGTVRSQGGAAVLGPGTLRLRPAGAEAPAAWAMWPFDEEGRAVVRAAAGRYDVEVHPRQGPQVATVLELPAPGSGADLVVPGFVVAGRVLGAATATAPVTVSWAAADRTSPAGATTVGPDGRFQAFGVAAGRYVVTAHDAAGAALGTRTVDVDDRDVEAVTLGPP